MIAPSIFLYLLIPISLTAELELIPADFGVRLCTPCTAAVQLQVTQKHHSHSHRVFIVLTRMFLECERDPELDYSEKTNLSMQTQHTTTEVWGKRAYHDSTIVRALVVHPSINFVYRLSYSGWHGAGAYQSRHWVKGGLHPGMVASQSEGTYWDGKPHFYIHSYIRNITGWELIVKWIYHYTVTDFAPVIF